MTLKDLRELIAELPDDVEVCEEDLDGEWWPVTREQLIVIAEVLVFCIRKHPIEEYDYYEKEGL